MKPLKKLLAVAGLAGLCGCGNTEPIEQYMLFRYKDSNENGLYDRVETEYHVVRTRRNGTKKDIIFRSSLAGLGMELPKEAIEGSTVLRIKDKMVFEK